MATSSFFVSGFLPRHHPLALTALTRQAEQWSLWRHLIFKNIVPRSHFPLWRQVVAMATFGLEKQWFWSGPFPPGRHLWPWRQFVVFAPFYVPFFCSNLDHFFSAQMG